MIKLYIDTSNNQEIKVKLDLNGSVKDYFERVNKNVEKTLGLISDVLKKNGLEINNIDKIYVKRGPGSFTGLRIGVSIANALSFALQKPLNDKKLGSIEDAIYS